MGTNFYAKIKIQPRAKVRVDSYLEHMKDAIDRDDCTEFSNTLDDLVYDWGDIKSDTVVHLGKRSFGWAFLWDLNNLRHYKPSLDSIISFIKENNAIIEDEYGTVFTLDEFLNDEIGYCLHPSDTPITKEELEESGMSENSKEYILNNYINKGKPYFQYCTSATYNKMHPTDYCDALSDHCNLRARCSEFVNDQWPTNYRDTDFVTKDNIRCAFYTDFS